MSIALDLFCFAVSFTMLFAAVLSVVTSVGGCEWPISARAVHMDVAFWQFSNNPPNSASVADAMTFLMMLHSTCTGLFPGGIALIGVLHFGSRKNIHLLSFVPLVLRCKMHPDIYGESFRFFYILLLRLDLTRCNLRIVWSVLRSLLLDLSVPSPGSLVPLTLQGQWL